MKFLALALLIVGCNNTPNDLRKGECVILESSISQEEARFHRCETKGVVNAISIFRQQRSYKVHLICEDKRRIPIWTRDLRRCNE
jgi:hypothetical protein